jgi:uncharacterized membrane protein YccC
MVVQIAAGSARESMSAQNRAFLDARDALDAMRQPRKKTEAERKLDEVLQDLKSQKSDAAKEAARRKLEQIKAKLNALKLAAGSAAATGDAKMARKVAKEIRDAARELGKALSEAGGGAAPMAVTVGSAAKAEQVRTQKDEVPKTASDQAGEQLKALASGNDLADLKNEATGLLREMKKIMRKLRETALHPDMARKDRVEMEKMLAEAERALSGLQAAALPLPGGVIDLSA